MVPLDTCCSDGQYIHERQPNKRNKQSQGPGPRSRDQTIDTQEQEQAERHEEKEKVAALRLEVVGDAVLYVCHNEGNGHDGRNGSELQGIGGEPWSLLTPGKGEHEVQDS